MKSKILLFFILIGHLCMSQNAEHSISCKTSEINKVFFKNNPAALKEHVDFNKFSKSQFSFNKKGIAENNYIIPVVFHVYGTTFNGRNVNDELIHLAMENLNKDFNGLNDDFNTVQNLFSDRRGSMNIQFKLVKKDPEGIPTTGIIYHESGSGYADDFLYNDAIANDAWDNYKYMNIYIQNDLFNDGVKNNSGYAYYPSTYMTDRNLDRIVYNGAYLATNTSKEFASTLTHEFGHWLNLYHTFENGCEGTDLVADTPQEDGNHDLRCNPGTNCNGVNINNENYMSYNGSYGCYKMFTEGQVTRMLTALQHPSRIKLWQASNLIDAGLIDELPYPDINWISSKISYTSNGLEFHQGNKNYRIEISTPEMPLLIIVKGPDYEKSFQTNTSEILTIKDITRGNWSIEIPEFSKKINNTFE